MTLTANSTVETADYAQMLRRMIRSYGRRVAEGDIEDLGEALAVLDHLSDTIGHAVTELREQQGYSWADIGRGAGISRQAAQQRWG